MEVYSIFRNLKWLESIHFKLPTPTPLQLLFMGTYLPLQNQQNKSKPFSSSEALEIFEKGYHVVLIIYCCVSNYHIISNLCIESSN